MTATPVVGTVLAEFDAVLDRARVWRVDWAVGLDVPEYQDPEVARSAGHPDIPVPPGALVFFSFLPDDSWLERAGICFDRSLAVRRQIRNHRQLYVGDVVHGVSLIDTVEVRSSTKATIVTTVIATRYSVDGELAAEESVTYSTHHPEEMR
jgi:hypothetical protein